MKSMTSRSHLVSYVAQEGFHKRERWKEEMAEEEEEKERREERGGEGEKE